MHVTGEGPHLLKRERQRRTIFVYSLLNKIRRPVSRGHRSLAAVGASLNVIAQLCTLCLWFSWLGGNPGFEMLNRHYMSNLPYTAVGYRCQRGFQPIWAFILQCSLRRLLLRLCFIILKSKLWGARNILLSRPQRYCQKQDTSFWIKVDAC